MQAQYRFIYRALATWQLYGNTDVDVKKFREHYRRLLQPSDERRQINGFSPAAVAALFKSGSNLQHGDGGDGSGRCATKIEEEFKVILLNDLNFLASTKSLISLFCFHWCWIAFVRLNPF